ncbi:MAG: class I SAM-dependent methyltransferase [Bacteroidota bacterium]|nr:class I SAM-dependent methyltransferase [Bacteroidota bacterium]
MADWFENWFESDEYLNVYRHRNHEDAKKLFDLIARNIQIPDKGTVLDLACGAGRHSILFAKRGYKVTSVDLSKNLLEIARNEAKIENVELNLIRCDIRKFTTDIEFDLVLNLFTSFGYFENDSENFAIFDTVYTSLKKDGFFVFDYLNKDFVEKNIVPEDVTVNNGTTILQTRQITGGRVVKNIKIQKEDKELSFLESVRLYSKDILVDELESRRFKVNNIFGDLNGNKFNKDSDRVIIIAKK